MRQITKPVFAIVVLSFVGWLVYGQVTEIVGGGRDVVLKVDGQIVRVPQFQAAYQAALENHRRQGGGRLTREDEQQLQNQVTDELIRRILLDREYRRLGISVSDDEVRRVARSTPPPQILRQILEDPTFQTDGKFDIAKWQRYLATATEEFRAQIEALYREYLPERKLEAYLTADLYVSDAKLWRIWRDQRESVTVALVEVGPDQIPDSLALVSEADIERYYAAHRNDYRRPAVAWLSFVASPRIPNAADTAAALGKARQVRAGIARGAVKFEDAAKQESADSVSGAQGGDLGWVKRNESGFDPAFLAGMRALRPGGLSQPVLSRFGYHLIRIDTAKGDSVRVRHILIPIVPQGSHLDEIESRADTLERLAADQTDGGRLDSAARHLGLPLANAPRLIEGDRVTLGQYVIPDVSVWAFEARVGETSPVIEGERAYYVFRLDSIHAAGVPPVAQIRDRLVQAVREEKKKEIARQRAEQDLAALDGAGDLTQAGRARGLTVRRLGPFTRLDPPPALARDPIVLGAAFALRPGERTGVVAGQTGFFLLQGVARKPADSAAWLAQRDQQRDAVMQPVQRARVQQYLAALRAQAKVVDRRNEIFRAEAASEAI